MRSGDWSLLFHRCVLEQLERLKAASDKAIANNPPNDALENANVKLYAALAKLMLETIPSDPARDEYRQGNTMGPDFRHWRRAKIGRRFRLFFRYDSRTKIIVYAWVNRQHRPSCRLAPCSTGLRYATLPVCPATLSSKAWNGLS